MRLWFTLFVVLVPVLCLSVLLLLGAGQHGTRRRSGSLEPYAPSPAREPCSHALARFARTGVPHGSFRVERQARAASPGARYNADQRAAALLRDMLTEAQHRQLWLTGYLELPSPSVSYRRYRIPLNEGLVKVYEQGRFCEQLCLQPLEPLPRDDLVVMHKLMIEGNENEYLKLANHLAP